jgi:hypothetical protein
MQRADLIDIAAAIHTQTAHAGVCSGEPALYLTVNGVVGASCCARDMVQNDIA